MSRLALLDAESAQPKAGMLLEKLQAARGRVANIFRAMANSPATLQGFMSFKAALGNGVIGPALEEKIALLAAELNRCEYCVAAHVPPARKAGLDDEAIAQARTGSASDPIEAGALRLAGIMIRHHGHVSDEEFAAARAAGLTDAQITEIVAHVALNIFTNYFNDVAQMEIDFPKIPLNPPMK
jgi:uncharacterized peroxidase-related enzyme